MIKLTYTTEDGATFDDSNQAKIHDAIKQTGVYLETYKMKDLVEELHKILVVEYRASIEGAKTPVESIITKDVYEGLGFPRSIEETKAVDKNITETWTPSA